MKVLVACEFSGVVREAFAAKGHEAWSCDLLPTEQPGNHIQGNVVERLDEGWDLMVAHPPCTYLANSGVKHLYEIDGQARFEGMKEGADFFLKLWHAPIPKICIENPVPHKWAKQLIGRYHQIIQPWLFNEAQTKATCFWLKGLPPLMATVIVYGKIGNAVHQCSPGPERWKKRSVTFAGVAAAMADQWG